MKVCKKQFPMGSFKGQKSDGFHIDGYLAENINIYSKKIREDMQFLGVISSSTFEVRTGKSTLAQQLGSYYTEKVNEYHNLDLKFDMKNIVFSYKDLIKRAFELPKCSCLVLDEGDDMAEHYASKVAKELRKFFRKSGQLNLFIIIIMPDYFELRSSYAISRSNFLIDVKFEGEFERGFFEFYSFTQKKWLYIKGKKYRDWTLVDCSFRGRFIGLYTVNKEEYLKAKDEDLKKWDEEEKGESKWVIKLKNRVRILLEFVVNTLGSQQKASDYLTNKGDKMGRTNVEEILDNWKSQ